MKIDVATMELSAAQQGLNLSQLACKACVARQTLSTIKGRGTCTAATLQKLASALDMDAHELLASGDNKRNFANLVEGEG